MPSSLPPIGFVIEGMTGPGSGSWIRFELVARALAAHGVEVHVLAAPHQIAQLDRMALTSATSIAHRSKVQRLVARSQDIDRFVVATGVGVLNLEVPPFVSSARAATIAMIHDLRGLHGAPSERLTAETAYQRWVLPRQVDNTTLVQVNSSWTAADVAQRLGVGVERIWAVPTMVVVPPVIEVDASIRGGSPFALVMGHLEARKNVATAIRATTSAAWPTDLKLVVAGQDAGEGRALQKLAVEAGNRVTMLGPIDEATKWGLLSAASMVLVPSLLEGLGLSAVEAPRVGTPVLVSDKTALPEVAGTQLAVVPALDSDAWARRVGVLFGDSQFRSTILRAQAEVAQRFMPDVVLATIERMYYAALLRHRA